MATALGHASPAFLSTAGAAAPVIHPNERDLLRGMERDVGSADRQQQQYFCCQCLTRCESAWDIIAGPHTGHSCLPLPDALQVLPSALSRQVQSNLQAWHESVEKPRRAQYQELDAHTEFLRSRRQQQRQALARLLAEMAETEQALASTAQAKAIAACNWRYQRVRMRRQAQLWKEGCARLQDEVGAQQNETEGDQEAWSHGWATAARELAHITAQLDARLAEWQADDAATEAAVQRLQQEVRESAQASAVAAGTQEDRDKEDEGIPAMLASLSSEVAAPDAAAAAASPPPPLELPFYIATQGRAPVRPVHPLRRTQPHVVTSPPASTEDGPQSSSPSPAEKKDCGACAPPRFPSVNEFALIHKEAARWKGGSAAPCADTAPLASSAAPATPSVVAEGRDDAAAAQDAARAARRRLIEEREAALQRAIQQVLAGYTHDGEPGNQKEHAEAAATTSPVVHPPVEHSPTTTTDQGEPARSQSSSLASLQRQLLEELTKEERAGHLN